MIRRKNISSSQVRCPSIDQHSATQHTYAQERKVRYNYLTNHLSTHNDKALEKDLSRCSQRSRYQVTFPHRQLDEHNTSISQCERLLRRNELYQGHPSDLIRLDHGEQQNKAAAQNQASCYNRYQDYKKEAESALRQKSQNRTTTNFDREATKTIRKADQSCNCSKSRSKDEKISQKSRYRSREAKEDSKQRLPSNQQDLDAKYEEIWNANQRNNRNVLLEKVEADQFKINYEQPSSGVIFNTRNNMLRNRRKDQTEEYKGYYDHNEFSSRDNNFASTQPCSKRDSYSLIQHKMSTDTANINRNTIPLNRSRNIDYALKPDPLRHIPVGLDCKGQLALCFDQRAGLRHETDVRLRMVEDFSSKISMRILELTTSLEEMRHKRR